MEKMVDEDVGHNLGEGRELSKMVDEDVGHNLGEGREL